MILTYYSSRDNATPGNRWTPASLGGHGSVLSVGRHRLGRGWSPKHSHGLLNEMHILFINFIFNQLNFLSPDKRDFLD